MSFNTFLLFLSDVEVKQIKEYVPYVLNVVQHLIIAEDKYNKIIALMGAENGRLEMLVLSPAERCN